ncbi:MAG: sensor domain-containing diguanylate cyclase [Candidatus Aerophobetes bacterium]|nr:sensor domain-containing diguanylate cyclase [Candidatus Aerophobetes bacterium]
MGRLFGKTRYKIREIIRESRQLRTILQINEEILVGQSFPKLLDHIVQSAVSFLEVDAGTLRLADEDLRFLVLKSTYGTHRDPQATNLPIGEKSSAGLSFLKGKPIPSLDISQEPLYPWNDGESKKFTSMLTVPLKVGNRNLGVFSVYTKKERKFSKSEVEMAEIFASQAALAIINRTYLDKFHRAAITEDLTGFYNAGYFRQRLNEEINRADRTHRPLSLLFVDLDHLKLINDSYGHFAGDKALRMVSEIIREYIRKVDIPARYGGDEIAVILPETDDIQAFQVAERIRRKAAGNSFHNNAHLTLSIGIATYPQDAAQAQDLLKMADRAVYQAKQKGRNQICSASSFSLPS